MWSRGVRMPERATGRDAVADEQRDKLAAGAHSITSSARGSSGGGTSGPSAWGGCMLITNSNLVGCTTGRAAGPWPLRGLPGVGADLTTHVHTIGRVAHQPTGFDSLASGIARGNPITRRERRKLDAPARKERVASDVQGFGAVAHESGEGRLDLAPGASLE